MASARHTACPRRERRPRVAVERFLLGLLAATLLGPAGVFSRSAHHHGTGQPDRDCLVCVFLKSVLQEPPPAAPIAPPAVAEPLSLPAPAPVAIRPVPLPASPRSPPVVAIV